ncbi:MAG: dCTP deaminase [Candidatus Methanoperedenaceae archaeon]|nr:MAG: dCTP deaminase [Candidatus Methanoperedenaceae archaeon]
MKCGYNISILGMKTLIKNTENVLSKKEILDRMYCDDLEQRLTITPLINKKYINEGSVDVRLGTEFIVSKRTNYSLIDPLDEDIETVINVYQDRLYVKLGKGLILHPNQFILGCTFEYVKFPQDLIGYVLGRSSWGRVGLVIATATFVNPGFAGVITLELTNLGNTPLRLYPGIRIAQLSLHGIANLENSDDQIKQSKYFAAIRPEFSKIHKDDDWKLLKYIKNRRYEIAKIQLV